jgi:hypothetical protein
MIESREPQSEIGADEVPDEVATKCPEYVPGAMTIAVPGDAPANACLSPASSATVLPAA